MINSLEAAFQVIGRPELTKRASQEDFGSRDGTLVEAVKGFVLSDQAKQAKVAQYSRFWGIERDVQTALGKLAAYRPAKLASSVYCLTYQRDGQTHQKFAAYDGHTTAMAVESFIENRSKLPYDLRKRAAVNLMRAINRYGVFVPDAQQVTLDKVAAYGYPDEERVNDAVIARARFVPDNDHGREGLAKLAALAQALNGEAGHDLTFVEDAIRVIEGFDTEFGLTGKYGAEIPMPEEIIGDRLVNSVISKFANDLATVRLVNGVEIAPANLSDRAKEMVGLEKLSQAELADVLPTLPKEDADLLVRYI